MRVLATCTLGAVMFAAGAAAPSSQPRFDEPWRPQYHFTPPTNFMNDPNGLVFFDGEYHLFYQHNPEGQEWGHMSWGHAVSTDLVHWQHLPVALREEHGLMIFSGSAVVDERNTSGLCDAKAGAQTPCLVAVYTAHRKGRQTQHLAFSRDRGRTWTKFTGNPIVDLGLEDFRDPKVFWHDETSRWIMAVALPHEHKIRFYTSSDLKQWTHASDFGPAGATGGVWECPDLFPLAIEGTTDRRWMLLVSLNPGGIAGGSGSQYFVGRFDGKRFEAEGDTTRSRWVDYGKDFYAAQSWSGVPATAQSTAPGVPRRVWIAWISNWDYANKEPTVVWRGAQSIPRELSLAKDPGGVRLRQRPIPELERLRTAHASTKGPLRLGDTPVQPIDPPGTAYEVRAVVEPGQATRVVLTLRTAPPNSRSPQTSAGERTLVVYDAVKGTVAIDRSRSGKVDFHPTFAGRQEAPLSSRPAPLELRLFVDRSSVELFAEQGAVAITDRIYPSPDATALLIHSEGGPATLQSLDVWKLDGIWVPLIP